MPPPPAAPPPAPPQPAPVAAWAGIVDDAHWGGEPNVAVGPDGEAYICAIPGLVGAATDPASANTPYRSSHLWRSLDGGRNWTWLDPNPVPGLPAHERGAAPGSGDCDVAVSSDGTVYLVDLTAAGVSLGVSQDQGATWSWTVPESGIPGDDRQWVAARGQDVYVAYHALALGLVVAHSADGGMTFRDQWVVVRDNQGRSCSCPSSNLVVSPDGKRLAVAWSDDLDGNGMGVAVSGDGGATWKTTYTPPVRAQSPIPSLAMDAKGRLAVASDDGGDGAHRIRVWVSETGEAWRALDVTSTGDGALPWVLLGDDGRATVSYAVADAKQDWTVHVAEADDVWGNATAWRDVPLSGVPALHGDLARPLADFFESARMADGSVLVAWTGTDGGVHRVWAGRTSPRLLGA